MFRKRRLALLPPQRGMSTWRTCGSAVIDGPTSPSPIERVTHRPPGQHRNGPTSVPSCVVSRPTVHPSDWMRFDLWGGRKVTPCQLFKSNFWLLFRFEAVRRSIVTMFLMADHYRSEEDRSDLGDL